MAMSLRGKSAEATHADRERAGMPQAPATSTPPNKPSRPSDKEIIELIAQTFGVSFGQACDWILETAERMRVAA